MKNSEIKKIKGVIFDFDGTLIDSDKLHYLALVSLLKKFGINFSEEDFSEVTGKQVNFIAESLIKKYKLKIKKEDLISQKRKITLSYFKNKNLKLKPYAKKAINFFAKNKIKIGLATGNLKEVVILSLKKANLDNFFSAIVEGKEVKLGKPYPYIYLFAAKKLKLKPQECLALEDTQYGIESAKSVGLFCFAIPSEFSKKQDFSKADKIFKNLKEVVKWYQRCV